MVLLPMEAVFFMTFIIPFSKLKNMFIFALFLIILNKNKTI